MRRLEVTLETAAANLALDEALLESAEAGELADEVLRIWESPEHAVVLGRSSDAAQEVRIDHCRRDGVEVLRRSSGGATVLIGPGCLMYAVILRAVGDAWLQSVDRIHAAVLDRMAEALRPLAPSIVRAGTSDLACAATATGSLVKVSGNSLRVKRSHVLYHGALLYQFDIRLLTRLLGRPAREPAYRGGRAHERFVANLPATRIQIANALIAAWDAQRSLEDWPRERTHRIVGDRFSAGAAWSPPIGRTDPPR